MTNAFEGYERNPSLKIVASEPGLGVGQECYIEDLGDGRIALNIVDHWIPYTIIRLNAMSASILRDFLTRELQEEWVIAEIPDDATE